MNSISCYLWCSIFQPGVAYKHAKEGTESSAFWFALGGKQSYTSKKVAPETLRDPHLYAFSCNKGWCSFSIVTKAKMPLFIFGTTRDTFKLIFSHICPCSCMGSSGKFEVRSKHHLAPFSYTFCLSQLFTF